jgi:hypothetical protein
MQVTTTGFISVGSCLMMALSLITTMELSLTIIITK